MLNGLSFFHFCHYSCRSVIAAMPSLHELHNLHLSFLSIHDLEKLFKFFLSFLASCCHHLLPIELSFLQGSFLKKYLNIYGKCNFFQKNCL